MTTTGGPLWSSSAAADVHWCQLHVADRTITGMVLHNLRVHSARPEMLRLVGGRCDLDGRTLVEEGDGCKRSATSRQTTQRTRSAKAIYAFFICDLSYGVSAKDR